MTDDLAPISREKMVLPVLQIRLLMRAPVTVGTDFTIHLDHKHAVATLLIRIKPKGLSIGQFLELTKRFLYH